MHQTKHPMGNFWRRGPKRRKGKGQAHFTSKEKRCWMDQMLSSNLNVTLLEMLTKISALIVRMLNVLTLATMQCLNCRKSWKSWRILSLVSIIEYIGWRKIYGWVVCRPTAGSDNTRLVHSVWESWESRLGTLEHQQYGVFTFLLSLRNIDPIGIPSLLARICKFHGKFGWVGDLGLTQCFPQTTSQLCNWEFP